MWFEELVGFTETSPEDTRERLDVEGDRMTSKVNGREMGCGVLEVVSLGELRRREAAAGGGSGPSTWREVVGDAGALHRDPANAGATFQVASQFNLLEMVSPDVRPEDGVTWYQNDRTQGPACAVACGAGTIYRNYFVELDGQIGQTRRKQIDCLAPVGARLFPGRYRPWTMKNGYALFSRRGLDRLNGHLATLDPDEIDAVRAELRVGIHRDVEVTSASNGHSVTQVYCSALPVAYNRQPGERFEPFARLVLEAAYEAMLLAAAESRRRAGTRTTYLTLLGGGAFGNDESWIIDAVERAADLVDDADLDIAVVSFGASNPAVTGLVGRR